MAHPLTKKVAKRLLYSVRAKSKEIYIALGRDPANLEPTVEAGAQKRYLFTYLLGKIISDDKITKDDLVKALKSTSVRHGKLADDLEKDPTIKGSNNKSWVSLSKPHTYELSDVDVVYIIRICMYIFHMYSSSQKKDLVGAK